MLRGVEIGVKAVTALLAAKVQPIAVGFLHATAFRASTGGVSRIDLNHLDARSLGFVAQYVEEPPVSPRRVVVASLLPSSPGPLAYAVKPLNSDGTASALNGNPHKLLCSLMLEVACKPCLPSRHADKGTRGGAGAFRLQLAPKSAQVLLFGLEVSSGEEVCVLAGGSDSQIPSASIHAENAAGLALRCLSDYLHVKLVAPPLLTPLLDELRSLYLPLWRLKIAALELAAAVGELLPTIHGRDRDDALLGIEPEVSATCAPLEIHSACRELGWFIKLVSTRPRGFVRCGNLANGRTRHLGSESCLCPDFGIDELLERVAALSTRLERSFGDDAVGILGLINGLNKRTVRFYGKHYGARSHHRETIRYGNSLDNGKKEAAIPKVAETMAA